MKYPDTNDREHDEPERQLQDCRFVAEQPLLRNAPAIQEEQRRQEQKEESIRLQFDAEIGDRSNECAERYLHERQRQSHRRHACERAADHDGQQEKQGNSNRLHGLLAMIDVDRSLARRFSLLLLRRELSRSDETAGLGRRLTLPGSI